MPILIRNVQTWRETFLLSNQSFLDLRSLQDRLRFQHFHVSITCGWKFDFWSVTNLIAAGIGRTADTLSILLQAAERELVALGPPGAVVADTLKINTQDDAKTIGAQIAAAQHFINQVCVILLS